MTAERKETNERPISPGLETSLIAFIAILTIIFLLVNHISESAYQARCRGYEEQIETSLQQMLVDKNELHLIQTNFEQYKTYCSAH